MTPGFTVAYSAFGLAPANPAAGPVLIIEVRLLSAAELAVAELAEAELAAALDGYEFCILFAVLLLAFFGL